MNEIQLTSLPNPETQKDNQSTEQLFAGIKFDTDKKTGEEVAEKINILETNFQQEKIDIQRETQSQKIIVDTIQDVSDRTTGILSYEDINSSEIVNLGDIQKKFETYEGSINSPKTLQRACKILGITPKILQEHLGVTADGIIGKNTFNAYKQKIEFSEARVDNNSFIGNQENNLTFALGRENHEHIQSNIKMSYLKETHALTTEEIQIIENEVLATLTKEELDNFANNIKKERDFLSFLKIAKEYPENFEELQTILQINHQIKQKFIQDNKLTQRELDEFLRLTNNLSTLETGVIIEQKDNEYGTISSNELAQKYNSSVFSKPSGIAGIMSIEDIPLNVHVEFNKKYDKYNFDNVPEGKKQDVLEVLKTIPEGWEKAVFRHAIKNPNFNANQPLLLQNVTRKVGVIYYPHKTKADIVPVVNGEGGIRLGNNSMISNKEGSRCSSLGSSKLSPNGYSKMPNAVFIHGLEPMKQTLATDLEGAQEVDPAEYGNANNNSRLIRIHAVRSGQRMTWGCPGLIGKHAQDFQAAIKKYNGGGLEAFASVT